jgi:hypothetical protein
LLGLLFDPKNGSNVFHGNVVVSPKNTAWQARRPYSSQSPLPEPLIQF